MSSPTNNFLSLIPAAHRVAVISPFSSSVDSTASEESVIAVLQKTRRSSSTATADSTSAVEEPSLPVDTTKPVVEAPAEAVNIQQFLKLGN